MFARICLSLLFASLVAVPALSQVEPGATGGATTTPDDTDMLTPPPVSGMPYASEAGADARSNYLSAGINVNAAYNDNVLPGANAKPISDESYWILPALSLNKSTGRESISLGYSPSFSFYQQTSSLDTVDHSASLVFSDRLTPHLSLSIQDYFVRTSNVFNESYPFSSGNLTGSTVAPVPALIVPYVEQMTDTANGTVSYQFGRDSMIGGGASYSTFSFPNPSAAAGLSNSDGEGGSAFFSRRFSDKQYFGLSYDYSRDVVADSPYAPYNTQLHTLLPFYSTFFTPKFSFSISAGIQHVSISQLTLAQGYSQWSAVGTTSVGWQGTRGSFALSYLHSVNSGEGFAETLTSDSVAASNDWKLAPTWTSSFSVSYVNSSPVTTRLGLTGYGYEGGNALTIGASLSHSMGDHLGAACGYDRLQENYPGIPFIANNPDSDRVYVTVTYSLRKSLGR